MITTTPSTDRRALFSADGSNWSDGSPLDWTADSSVTKIVIGQPPQGDESEDGENEALSLAEPLPQDLARRFPNLTHLHLWCIDNLTELPELPEQLQCLDVRGCSRLARLPQLPDSLETLIVERCPHVTGSQRTDFPMLDDLSLRGCHSLDEHWLREVLRSSPVLRKLDVSDCPQITQIKTWASNLIDIRCDGCSGLEALPSRWPLSLRRIGLRGATKVPRLADFPETLDYVDLVNTESLRRLPKNRGNPRTMFLYGSGILVPPASEHGQSADESVAARTKAFFRDIALTGKGEVKRCKLLILGNGDAGKTCLSLAITGRDSAKAARLGTTHGVQFWDWDFTAKVDGAMDPVHLHLWDFGGQEIYHNTHRLFMSKGAVFVVVWKPSQDGCQPKTSRCQYQDEWRPLQYWLDFIHLACPDRPRIAIVCSHHDLMTDELESQWRGQVRPEFHEDCKCFYIDSRDVTGELSELESWLEREVGDVITTQGVKVPSYWEIAQDMIENWVHRLDCDKEFAERHNQVQQDEFRDALRAAIDEAVTNDREGRYSQLGQSIVSGDFELTHERVCHTLAFLTHSGWLYWDPHLFEGRVIVGQKWALKGLYAILDRRPDSDVFRELVRSDGRFTFSRLGALVWDADYSETEQALLRSFMERCGLCFQLRPGEEAWREEDVYVSFEHLPTEKELGLRRAFDVRLSDLRPLAQDEFRVPLLHKQHWQSFLTDAGRHYGKDAQYAGDGFYLENEEGQKLLIVCELDRSGLGGVIEVLVAGPEAVERMKAAKSHLRQFLHGAEERQTPDPRQSLGARSAKQEVFISYAWNPRGRESGAPDAIDYEQPVDAIEAFLSDKPVQLHRDKNVMGPGDEIRTFMDNGARHPRVIVVHSNKYFRSPNCVYELKVLFDELRSHEGKSVLSVVIPIEHAESNVTDQAGLELYLEYWRNYAGTVPTRLRMTRQELSENAIVTIRDFSRDLDDRLDLNLHWGDGEAMVLAEISKRLGLDSETQTSSQGT